MPKVEIIISMRVNDLENELLNFNEKVFLMADTEYFRFIRIQYSFKMSHYIKVAYGMPHTAVEEHIWADL